MIPPETYLGFHALFTLPVIALLLVVAWWRETTLDSAESVAGLGIILVLAVAYTTPWDNLLIEAGVWEYGDGVVWQSIWAAPVGEYLFFVLQPVMTVLFLSVLPLPTDTDLRLSRKARTGGFLAGVCVSVLGVGLMAVADSWLYMGSMLAWAGPILGVQWAFGWTHLVRARRTVALAIAVPTVYLWLVDYTAISLGLWVLSDTYTLGIAPFGFPIEEAVFFVLSNTFVVQGFVLYVWVTDRWVTVAESPYADWYLALTAEGKNPDD